MSPPFYNRGKELERLRNWPRIPGCLPRPGSPGARLGEGTRDAFLSEECELLLGEEILQAWMGQLKSDTSFTQFQILDKVSFLEPGPK